MTDKNMPERELDSIMNLTQRMRELKLADIYGIWDWDSEAFDPRLTLIEFNLDSKIETAYLTRWSNELRTLALERLKEKQDLSGLNNNAINTLVEPLIFTDEIIHLREKRLMQKVKATHEAEESAEADANIEFLRQFAKPSPSSPPTPPYLTPRPSAYDIPPADSIYAAKVSDLVQSEQSDCELDIANVLANEFTLLRQAIDSLPRLIAEQLKQPTVKKESEKEKKYRAARQFAESNTTPIPQRSEKNKAKEELLELLRLVDPATAVYHDILLALEKMTSSSTR